MFQTMAVHLQIIQISVRWRHLKVSLCIYYSLIIKQLHMIPQISYFLPTTWVFYLRTLNKGYICSTEHSSKILEDLRSQLNIFVYSASTFILKVDTYLHLFLQWNIEVYFWHYLGIICIIFGANLALLLISIGAGTTPSNSAIWDGFIEQHKKQTTIFNDQLELFGANKVQI